MVALEELAAKATYRVARAIRPAVTVTDPPDAVAVERDVEVVVRDGTVLRVDVYRPVEPGPHPALLCAHPYGKDNLPRRRRSGGYSPPAQARLLPQSVPYEISAWTSWEAPDPATWVPRGYALVNADLRGWGRSEGVGELLSGQEGDDGHDLVEWIADQPWCTGKVGMSGVSYLAIVQWTVAATRPPHLAAICPWEGFTDFYRDLARPGGIREDGFTAVWARAMRAQRRSPVEIRAQQRARPLYDEWWAARCADLEQVDVPALVCGSFSDHNLHSVGSFAGFERISSPQRWLYTHRGPKWSTYYGPAAVELQARFFDRFLKGVDTGMEDMPPVRLEVRESVDAISSTRHEAAWPLPGTRWSRLHLHGDDASLSPSAPTHRSGVTFSHRRGRVVFGCTVEDDVELIGPMSLRLHVSVEGTDDVSLFAGVRLRREGRVVGFEGSYGYRHAYVALGWLRTSHRALDHDGSTAWAPAHRHDRVEPLESGEVVAVDVALAPSATQLREGDRLEVVVSGRWLEPVNPLFGQFPARYQPSKAGRCTIHCGPEHDSSLLAPFVGEIERALGEGRS